MKDIAQRRAMLEARLAELEARLQALDDALDVPVTADWDDNAAEHEDDEVLESLGEAGVNEIRMINAALGRIDAGTYGICVECGNDILPERLDLLPYTPFCRVCAANRAAQ